MSARQCGPVTGPTQPGRSGGGLLAARGSGRALFGRVLGLGGVAAALGDAAEANAGLVHLLDQEGGAALGAGARDGAIPGDEVALGLGVVRAAEEHLAPAR